MPLGPKVQMKPADWLERCRQQMQEAEKGYRRALYAVYQDTMKGAVQMVANEDELNEFLARNDLDRKDYEAKGTSWVALSAFVFVTEDYGRGWKAARVTEFLHDVRGVPVEQLANKMRKLGGIEKILKLAAEESPKRSKSASAKGKSGKKLTSKKSPDRLPTGIAESDDWEDDGVDETEEEITTVTMRLPSALHVEMMMTKPGSRMRLVCARLAHDTSTETAFVVQKVRQL